MKNYVKYTVTLEEPLRMGVQGDQANTEALSYIAGSTLRGAIINRYIHDNNISETELNRTETANLLFKDTRFTDAYLQVGEKSLIPVPAVYYMNKHKRRKSELDQKGREHKEFNVYTRLDTENDDAQNDSNLDSVTRIDVGSFCEIKGNSYETHPVHKVSRLHIKTSDVEKERDLFRFEAIDSGQQFTGFIICKDQADAEKFKETIEGSIFYLGGAKGSGYGRVTISSVRLMNYEESIQSYDLTRKSKDHQIRVYALSHLALVDKYGNVNNMIETAWLEDKLGITDVKLTFASTAVMQTSGFNHKWKAGSIKSTAVAAGSWFVYSYDKVLDEEKFSRLTEVEEKGVGTRKQEGFGRILFNPDFNQLIKEVNKGTSKIEAPERLSSESSKILQNIQAAVNKNRMHNAIISYALECKDASISKNFSLTQISSLYSMLDSALMNYTDADSLKKKVNGFINDMKKEKDTGLSYKNENAKQTFASEHVLIKNGKYWRRYSLEDMLQTAIDSSHGLEVWFPEFNTIPCWGDIRPYSEIQQKLMFIKEFAYAFMRKEGDRQ